MPYFYYGEIGEIMDIEDEMYLAEMLERNIVWLDYVIDRFDGEDKFGEFTRAELSEKVEIYNRLCVAYRKKCLECDQCEDKGSILSCMKNNKTIFSVRDCEDW